MLGRRVYQDVDLQEMIAILGACFVQVYKVYAHPLFLAGFLDHYKIF